MVVLPLLRALILALPLLTLLVLTTMISIVALPALSVCSSVAVNVTLVAELSVVRFVIGLANDLLERLALRLRSRSAIGALRSMAKTEDPVPSAFHVIVRSPVRDTDVPAVGAVIVTAFGTSMLLSDSAYPVTLKTAVIPVPANGINVGGALRVGRGYAKSEPLRPPPLRPPPLKKGFPRPLSGCIGRIALNA